MNNLQIESFKLAKKYVSTHKDYVYLFESYDDYLMSLTYTLLYKLPVYNKEKALFSTYAYMVFDNTIKRQSCIKYAERKDTPCVNLEDYVTEDICLKDCIADETNNIDEYIENSAIQAVYKELAPYLSEDFIQHFAYNINYEDIAKNRGVSRQAVRRKVLNEKLFIDECVKGNLITHTKTHKEFFDKINNMKKVVEVDRIL